MTSRQEGTERALWRMRNELMSELNPYRSRQPCRLHPGAWLIHIVLILIGKVLVDSIPGMEQDTSWTIVLQGYLLVRRSLRQLLRRSAVPAPD